MKSRFLSRMLAALAAALLLGSALPAAAIREPSTFGDCRNALSAGVAERLMEQLGGKKAAYADDDLAGVYIDEDNRLVVSVTSEAAKDRFSALLTDELIGDAVEALAGSYGGALPFDEAALTENLYTVRVQPYSAAYLNGLQEALSPHMDELGIYLLSVDEAANRLAVSTESADGKARILAFLREREPGFDESALQLTVEKNTIQLEIERTFLPNWRNIALIAAGVLAAAAVLIGTLFLLRRRRRRKPQP